MRYRIILVNKETGERRKTTWGFDNKDEALEWKYKWEELGFPFGAIIEDLEERKDKYDRYYVCKITDEGVEYKRTKCLDYWSTDKSECWQYSKQGAKNIVKRLTNHIPSYAVGKVNYFYELVNKKEEI